MLMSNKPVYDSSEISSRFESRSWEAHALRKAVEYDAYGSKTTFRVRVLTRPNNINKEDYEAIFGSDVPVVAAGTNYTRYMFKGRIEKEDGVPSPHQTLPDPCNITDASDPECAARIISWHTTFMSGDNVTGPRPEVGDIVKVTLAPGDVGKYNLQYAVFDRLENQAANPGASAAVVDCALKMTELFAGNIGNAMSLGAATAGAVGTAAAAGTAASQAQTGTYLPTNLAIVNGSLASHGLIQRATKGSGRRGRSSRPKLLKDVVGDYDRLAEAFRAQFPDRQLGGWGDRTYERQVQLKKEKPRLAAPPGTSKHGWGVAVDLHYYLDSDPADAEPHSITFSSAEFKWLTENSRTYGWYHPRWAQQDGSKPEPWHWESTKDTQLIRVDPE